MFYRSKWYMVLSGIILGLCAVILAYKGNPGNMAICIICFIRDIAGSLKMHTADPVRYFRPEIVGIILGSFIISLIAKEFKSTAGSSPLIRFLLGIITGISSLIFLGCPLRMLIRMSAGDINAYIAFLGFVLGIITGVLFLERGFSLGKSYKINNQNGYIFPIMLTIMFILSICIGSLFLKSKIGPGSLHAPIYISLICGLIFGIFSQRSGLCITGGIRDLFLMKAFSPILIVVIGLFLVMLGYNLYNGSFCFSMSNQPIAHQEILWNILSMYSVGFAAVLSGGCPLRQLVLTAQGSCDSLLTVLGFFVGTILSHNFGLASSGDMAINGKIILGKVSYNGKICLIICIILLFIIAFSNKRKQISF